MRKIDVRSYKVEVKDLATGQPVEIDYDVNEMLVGILLHHTLGLTGAEIYKRTPIANKITKAKLDVLLEDEEYSKLLDAVNRLKGFGMNDREMVRRVIEAQEVTVAEAGKKDGQS